MALLVRLLCLVTCLCALQASDVDDNTLDQLESLEMLNFGDEDTNKRGLLRCKSHGEPCKGVPRCCGRMQCYWRDGYKPFTKGVCVLCVKERLVCQRDDQCCSNLQCDKTSRWKMNGNCGRYRRVGACYRDGQCVNGCRKRWYQRKGTCY